MANKKTITLTSNQYQEIIQTIRKGFLNRRPNNQIATILVLEANLGLRLSDVLNLTLNSIIKDGERYRLNIKELKTNKERTFTVLPEIYLFIKQYCIDNEIKSTEKIFNIGERAVQKHLKLVCDYLAYPNDISTHSFRKYFATEIYTHNNFNIALVQHLLQHSSPITTQKYIGIGSEELEAAIRNHIQLL